MEGKREEENMDWKLLDKEIINLKQVESYWAILFILHN